MPDILKDPVVEEMEKARERVKAGSSRIKQDKNKRG